MQNQHKKHCRWSRVRRVAAKVVTSVVSGVLVQLIVALLGL